jgi:hypothetical protein
MSARRNVLVLLLAAGLLGCGGRTPATGWTGGDGGAVVLDDGGNPVLDDGGHPIPVTDAPMPVLDGPPPLQQDAAVQPDTGATPGVVPCGNTTCEAATQQCCVNPQAGTATCIGANDQCQGLAMSCDGPEDCSGGTPVCCATVGGQNRDVSCTAAADCSGRELCRVDGDCRGGDLCCGEFTLGGIAAKFCRAASNCPAPPPLDGGPQPPPGGTGVACGGATCTAPQVCCVSISGGGVTQSCTSASACQTVALTCDGPEDCSSGAPECCAQVSYSGGLSGGSECVASGTCNAGMLGGVLCHTTADCPPNQNCQTQMGFSFCR